jgi:hypothetical protein
MKLRRQLGKPVPEKCFISVTENRNLNKVLILKLLSIINETKFNVLCILFVPTTKTVFEVGSP